MIDKRYGDHEIWITDRKAPLFMRRGVLLGFWGTGLWGNTMEIPLSAHSLIGDPMVVSREGGVPHDPINTDDALFISIRPDVYETILETLVSKGGKISARILDIPAVAHMHPEASFVEITSIEAVDRATIVEFQLQYVGNCDYPTGESDLYDPGRYTRHGHDWDRYRVKIPTVSMVFTNPRVIGTTDHDPITARIANMYRSACPGLNLISETRAVPINYGMENRGPVVDSRHEVCQTLADPMCPNEPEMATKVAEVLEDKFGPAEYETMEVAHAE